MFTKIYDFHVTFQYCMYKINSYNYNITNIDQQHDIVLLVHSVKKY